MGGKVAEFGAVRIGTIEEVTIELRHKVQQEHYSKQKEQQVQRPGNSSWGRGVESLPITPQLK